MPASPSPSPHRSPPRQPEPDDGGAPADLPPLAQMQPRTGADNWSEETPAPPPPPHSTSIVVSKAAQYIPPRSSSHTADPGRGGDGWYSWNGGRSRDRRARPAPPPLRPQQPPPPPRTQPQPKPKPKPQPQPAAPPAQLPRVAFDSPQAPAPHPPTAATPAPAPASARPVERGQHGVVPDILSRKRRAATLRRTALVARGAAAGLCLAALAVLAADHRKGWALDSYSNYRQFQYSEAVNVIGFLYSVFQFFALAEQLRSNKHLIPRPKGDYFDFTMDQVLSYLLISSSSSATARVGDWIDNWGSDPFPKMANSSIAISFMAFVVFAISSLISAYNLFRRDM